MVFSDIFFLFEFLPLFLVCYFAASKTPAKNIVLICFSLFFYSWGEPVWVCLLLFSSVFDYFNGRFIAEHKDEKKAVLGVIASCTVNLSILAVFKYSGMLVTGINGLFSLSLPVPGFHMPIGISFYTFQSITYVVDVYRGQARAQKNYLGYLLYLSMFFQLVAGPIVRYSAVSREIENRSVMIAEFSDGITRLIMGLGKKVLLANSIGSIADELLGFEGMPSSVLAAWAGVILYSLQIYFDFSGYSDMAIGMGLMCGFHFPENFNYPYVSRSATEFWRRWHISLGSFFRDYLYIPLGGNRRHQLLNLTIVWFCTGLWHGASTNFILWGLYFGVLLIIEKKFLLKVLDELPKFVGHLYLIIAVIFGWMIFYFTDMSRMGACFGAMFGKDGTELTDLLTQSKLQGSLWLIMAAIILCTPVYRAVSDFGHRVAKNTKGGFVIVSAVKMIFLLGILLLSFASLAAGNYNAFLYTRF